MQLLERDAQLEPGQVRAEAPVHAAAECEVAVGGALEVDVVGLREPALVDVRRAEQDRDPLARFQSLAADLDVLG